MFTSPPRPPKDYFIKDVQKSIQTAPEHTPLDAPRVTQTTLGKFCYPIEADINDPAETHVIERVNERILDNWAKIGKASWVDSPGKNDYLLHDVYRRYSVSKGELDPRYQNRVKLFQRTYAHELDYIEERRLNKLRAKMAQEDAEESQKIRQYNLDQKSKEKASIELIPCVHDPPFWWQKETQKSSTRGPLRKPKIEQKSMESFNRRWQERPELIESEKVDCCKRREALALCNLPYKHEACNWYYKNYPMPDNQYIPEKFSK